MSLRETPPGPCTADCLRVPRCQHQQPDDDLPPWLAMRIRDTTETIVRRAAFEAAAKDQPCT